MPKFKEISRSYGFDEVSIIPGAVTLNPDQTNIDFTIRDIKFDIPVLASAMDAVVSPETAIKLGQLGALGILNLEGIWSRHENAQELLDEIANESNEGITKLMQKIYSAPMKENLIGTIVEKIKSAGVKCSVSLTPQNTKRLAPMAVEAGADILVVQSTVTTARHISKSYRGLILSELVDMVKIPVVVGNCVTYAAALELMETGIDALLIGVGPGAACTTREVVGVGVPQISATINCSAARQEHYDKTGKYVSVIVDGGIRTGGDLCKSFASGADAVMIGTPLAQANEAPGKGHNWGMATPHPDLPRGTRINVGTKASLKEILFGPSSLTNGTMNLIGALRIGMGMVGAANIREMQQSELAYAPDIKSEGKVFQRSGN